jgi:hypothetical protein
VKPYAVRWSVSREYKPQVKSLGDAVGEEKAALAASSLRVAAEPE